MKVETRDRLVMPATLELRYADGTRRRVAVPVEAWRMGAEAIVNVAGGPAVREAVIDPDHRLPDRDRSDDAFSPPSR